MNELNYPITFTESGGCLVAKLPSQIVEILGDTLYITICILPNALAIMPEETWKRFIQTLESRDERKQRMLLPLIAQAAKVKVMPDGAFTLPSRLAEFAHIHKEAAIHSPDSFTYRMFPGNVFLLEGAET